MASIEELKPIVACVTVGIFQENCYLYACPHTREAVIIDPGDEAEKILHSIRVESFTDVDKERLEKVKALFQGK